jgi:hypothetical protein
LADKTIADARSYTLSLTYYGMQQSHKLKRYFDLDVSLDQEVNPFILTSLNEKADKYAQLAGFDPEEHFVYVHTLKLGPANSRRYFARSIPVEKRVSKFSTTFKVNKKQSKSPGHELIRFVDASVLEYSATTYFPVTQNKLSWEYPGSFLIGSNTFTTQIITWVSKDLHREDFKKVKLQIQVDPTDEFRSKLVKGDRVETPTEFDIPLSYEKDIKFILKRYNENDIKRLMTQFELGTKERLKNAQKREKVSEEIAMDKQSRSDQPTLAVGGNVTNLTIVTNASKFSVRQLGEDGIQLSTLLDKMLAVVQAKVTDPELRERIEEAIVTTNASRNKQHFTENYKQLMDVIKPCYDILADFLPRLVQYL